MKKKSHRGWSLTPSQSISVSRALEGAWQAQGQVEMEALPHYTPASCYDSQ